MFTLSQGDIILSRNEKCVFKQVVPVSPKHTEDTILTDGRSLAMLHTKACKGLQH